MSSSSNAERRDSIAFRSITSHESAIDRPEASAFPAFDPPPPSPPRLGPLTGFLSFRAPSESAEAETSDEADMSDEGPGAVDARLREGGGGRSDAGTGGGGGGGGGARGVRVAGGAS